jgi:chromatin-remodeling ATPase INO80
MNGELDESMSREDLPETNGRKKRKTVASMVAAEDQDYQPPGLKRVCLLVLRNEQLTYNSLQRTPRRNPPRGKQPDARTQASLEPPEAEPIPEEYHHEPTEDERRLVSSDLEDCPEIWQGELGSYILEIRKRQKQIDAHFNRWIIVWPLFLTHSHYLT